MALICMAVYETAQNKKKDVIIKTVDNINRTVNWDVNRVIFVNDNPDSDILDEIYGMFIDNMGGDNKALENVCLIKNDTNIGTAASINKALKCRMPGENAIKMDDDVIIHKYDWTLALEEAISRDPRIGIIGLKRKDLAQSPHRTDWAKSRLIMLPHQPGENWIVVEQCNDVMGTCTMFSSSLLDKVGYMYQLTKYGFDDNFMAHRSIASGFYNCFLCNVNIDHIDISEASYQDWKHKESGIVWEKSVQMFSDIMEGKIGYYFDPDISPELIFKP